MAVSVTRHRFRPMRTWRASGWISWQPVTKAPPVFPYQTDDHAGTPNRRMPPGTPNRSLLAESYHTALG